MLASQMGQAGGPGMGVGALDFERLRVHLARALARACPRVLADRREDLLQDCLVRVMDLVTRSGAERQFSASYLYKVAHSTLIDEIRRMRRRRETPLEEGEPVATELAESNPETSASGHEIGRGIQDCLTRLARERRLGVALYLQGHSASEAARVLDWNLKKAENLIYRGLADLRDCLAAKGMRP
jgi:RNA polymerase sigma-70 factor, ECF subfamily